MRVCELLPGGPVEVGQVPGDIAPLGRHHLVQDVVPHAYHGPVRHTGPAIKLRDPALEQRVQECNGLQQSARDARECD